MSKKSNKKLYVDVDQSASDELTNDDDEQQHRVFKHIIDKLETYAHKSHLWRLIHGSGLRHNLLRRSRHVSKLYSIPDNLVYQYINQLCIDVDQYVTQLHRLIYSQQINDMISVFNQTNTRWYIIRVQRARQLFSNEQQQQLNDNDLLQIYSKFIHEKFTPHRNISNIDRQTSPCENVFDLNVAYRQAECKGKDLIDQFRTRKTPDLRIIDEMIQLGMNDMKKIPSREDFERSDSFFDRILIFHRMKEAYQSILQNTSDDFMLLRFGKTLNNDHLLQNTQQMNKQFAYLLHHFLNSISILFQLLINTKDTVISSTSDFTSLFFIDQNISLIKFHGDLLSPLLNIDQWTWLLEQWHDVLRTMPMIFTQAGAFSRLVRTTIGIGLMYLGKCAEIMINNDLSSSSSMSIELINEQLFVSLQKGFYFGVAYAIVDCLQDEIHNCDQMSLDLFLHLNDHNNDEQLTPSETIDQWLEIMEELLLGKNFDRNQLPKTPFTSMLIEAFDNLSILIERDGNRNETFNEFALLLRSQRLDQKDFDQSYNDEQLYLGSIMKSHFISTCTNHLVNRKCSYEENDHLWLISFLGQLNDDCRDWNDDLKSKSVTPFTYYAHLIQSQRIIDNSTILNPLELFLNLCSNLYLLNHRNDQIGAFLGRRIIRSLHSIEISGNDQTSYVQFVNIFCGTNSILHNYLSKTKFRKRFCLVTDPEKIFFRLLDHSSIKYARTNRKLETFICENLMRIENALEILPFHPQEDQSICEEQMLISAMNYSVKAGGKRLRPLLMLIIADLYQIQLNRILPLTCGIEYLHTSSLIFDDLPAQDNSDLRRGQLSLHKTQLNNDIPHNLCEGRAQLAAVDLIAISMGLINHGLILNGFLPERVNQVVGQISSLMHDLCIGQMMDLRAAHLRSVQQDHQQIDQLDRIASFKTGKTIEIVMIMPVILATSSSEEQQIELTRIRELSRLMGIMFQMRDDLLDIEGEGEGEGEKNIGKPTLLDMKNNTLTYVSILGVENTRLRLEQFLKESLQLVDQCWPTGAETIKDVIKYIVHRKT